MGCINHQKSHWPICKSESPRLAKCAKHVTVFLSGGNLEVTLEVYLTYKLTAKQLRYRLTRRSKLRDPFLVEARYSVLAR